MFEAWEIERASNAAEDAMRNAAYHVTLRDIEQLGYTRLFLALSEPRDSTNDKPGIVGYGGN